MRIAQHSSVRNLDPDHPSLLGSSLSCPKNGVNLAAGSHGGAMIFIWGKKLVYSKLGYVADFCPICRSPQAFEVQSVGVASHVYYVSFGKGALAGYQRKCCDCGVTLDAKPTNYATISDHLR